MTTCRGLQPTRSARIMGALGLAGALLVGVSGCTPGTGMLTDRPTSTAAPTSQASCKGAAANIAGRSVSYDSLPAAPTFSDRVAAAGGRVVTLGAQSVTLPDFATVGSTLDAAELGPAATGLVGAGSDRTVFEMTAHTSTHAADVTTIPGAPNQLSLMQVVGDGAVLRGFSMVGTDQGHLYNGLRVARVADLRASDIRVVGIPGNSSSPPGETFGINDFRTSGSRWSDIDVDGAHVGASGFGINSSRDITICDSDSHDNAVSMGFAFWQTHTATLVDCTATDNGYSGFNFERSTGTNTLIRPVSTGNRYAMRVASDQASAKFRIIDPHLVDGHWTITLPINWNHAPNLQKRSDITLIVDGKSRPDLLRFQATAP